VGERFGPLWATYWFRVRATVPEAWAGSRVDLLWRTGTESTLWTDGRPRQGLSTGDGYDRPDAVLLDPARGGELLELEVELACNGHFGAPFGAPPAAEPAHLEQCELARFDPEAWDLAHDFRVLQELEAAPASTRRGPASSRRSWTASCDCGTRPTAPPGRRPARSSRACWRAATAPWPTSCGRSATGTWTRHGCGRCGRPGARSSGPFSTSCELMRRYPEHRFAGSAAQHYAWVKERDPALFAQVRAAVDPGPVGARGRHLDRAGLQPAVGESLVRQLLHGQRFFERELGRAARSCGTPTSSATRTSFRSSCAAPACAAS
jgi:alpha-mannosidase